MNNNLREYIESFNNIIWLYRNIIDNKILENENLKSIDNEAKKELFDYIFDKYLDSESELNSLSVDSRYYSVVIHFLNKIEIFLPIEEYCNNKIRDEIKKIKISNVRDIFMHLDMALFLDDKSLLNKIPFSEYLSFISDSIKDINYGNGYYYAKSMPLIFIINLLLEKIKEKEDIDKILDVIKKFDEFGQYNILEYIIYSLDEEEIKSDLIYNNLIKYCIELFNEEKLRKSHLNKRITKILEVIIDAIFEDIERLKFILDIYFPKDEKELEEIYQYIDYKEKYKLDIPLYCLSKNKVDIKNTLTDIQCDIIIKYLALYVRKDKDNEIKIIVKNILDEDIDLRIYWNLVRENFLEYCSKTFDIIFFNRYRNILQLLNPTVDEFNNFSEQVKNVFYWHLIKEDNKELYSLIPEEVKKAIEIDKRYKEKIGEEKRLFQEERIKCVHKFFDKNKILEDIDNIIKALGNNPTFQDLSYYNDEYYKGKYENKEKYLESEIIIINPFIIDYFLIVSKYLIKNISMSKIKEYVENYWDKHWGIHLYNYLKRKNDIVDRVSFDDNEKDKIKNYFKSYNYSETIKDLHNCLEGTFDNSYLYFIFYNLENIFKDIKFEYDEEILINMLKIPYDYYKGDIKLYNNYYYLEYFGVIMEYDADNINFDIFFIGNEEMKSSIFKKLIESIDKDMITNEFGSYYALLSIIKLYNSDKENLYTYYNKIVELVAHFYTSSLNKVEFSQIYNIINSFVQENNLDNNILDIINESKQINYDHLKYINNLQRKLLEEEIFYTSSCYKLIYEIRRKINSKDIKISHNINPSTIENIKYELNQLYQHNNFDYLNQVEFNNLKNKIKNISDKFINDTDLNFEESMIYNNLLYLQNFIVEDITIWQKFTEFLINNKDYYYSDMIIEKLIFENLFEYIDKNNFKFDFFIDNLILLYNSIIEKPYKDGIIPNETLIHRFLDNVILALIDLKLDENLYKNIYDNITYLNYFVKNAIKGNIFNDFPPVKITIKNGEYFVYDLENNFRFETNDIDDLVKRLVPNDFNNVSRILKFQYLLNDINNETLTMSHPYIFEDKNECLYSLDKKVYMACFSKTIDKDNAYAWWKIYGITPDDNLENIKVRIIFNKRDLLKNILLKKDKNFEYYFGDIKYIGDKKEKNDDIKDFFEKSTSFKFEREFRILIKYIGIDEIPNDKYNDKYKIFFKLDLDNKLYKSITLDNKLSFDPYRNLEGKHKEAIKHILKEAQDKI
ncbi:hypothetical protein EPJ64_04905 [Brachyspira aalborgi]|jgi:hypothetical protein|uniref:Uncharacterized protein n=1 Tax=Brachyspira aalborgi TaxID=29522 RepID=A0AB38PZ53_9SPIR|nr:hypothetical protein [Brachyspira aalborgi]CCY75203.1 putative uncharacterized protein [Brachyspira sp. CAG:700]TXJ15968.1 hypothetical protein EPJ77_04925 [Brachyspira aalborgi]TXJ19469.1 hypothetical protein EPJ64_04905 [Brachyspira aalborgi]TXJ26219.1 hypothetical protein EPJ73_05270 [Brachyspira aalborgi]TXJ30705.1 hypothetical protein EPJ71_12250 [Brachyspira aalborgi]